MANNETKPTNTTNITDNDTDTDNDNGTPSTDASDNASTDTSADTSADPRTNGVVRDAGLEDRLRRNTWAGVLARGLDSLLDVAIRRWFSGSSTASTSSAATASTVADANTTMDAASTRVLVDLLGGGTGSGNGSDAGSQDYGSITYAKYYATSAAVHAAVKVLAEAVARPPLKVLERARADAPLEPADPSHPMQRLLDRPNTLWTAGEFWRAVESWLALTGSAFVQLELEDERTPIAMWPLRSDQVRVLLSDDTRSVTGFVHESADGSHALLPHEMLWFRRFNPMQPYAGMSSIAPSRVAVDMGHEAMRYNRAFFRNSAVPSDLVIKTENALTRNQAETFLKEWAERYSGSHNAHLPVLLSGALDVARIGMSHRDMEFIAALSWSVEEVSRAFGVPKVFLSEFEDATLANVRTMEQFLWRNTIVPELRLFESVLNARLAPQFAQFPGQLGTRFDLTQIEAIQESQTERADRVASLVASGIISVAEARTELGMAA